MTGEVTTIPQPMAARLEPSRIRQRPESSASAISRSSLVGRSAEPKTLPAAPLAAATVGSAANASAPPTPDRRTFWISFSPRCPVRALRAKPSAWPPAACRQTPSPLATGETTGAGNPSFNPQPKARERGGHSLAAGDATKRCFGFDGCKPLSRSKESGPL